MILLFLQEYEAVSAGVVLNLPSMHDIKIDFPRMGSLTKTQQYGVCYSVQEYLVYKTCVAVIQILYASYQVSITHSS